jgi:hypothetical protein
MAHVVCELKRVQHEKATTCALLFCCGLQKRDYRTSGLPTIDPGIDSSGDPLSSVCTEGGD